MQNYSKLCATTAGLRASKIWMFDDVNGIFRFVHSEFQHVIHFPKLEKRVDEDEYINFIIIALF